jgi:hypothetical protein
LITPKAKKMNRNERLKNKRQLITGLMFSKARNKVNYLYRDLPLDGWDL